MERIADGIYRYKDKVDKGTKKKPFIRIWHDCKKYKDRPKARVELERKLFGKFKCPFCGFEYGYKDF